MDGKKEVHPRATCPPKTPEVLTLRCQPCKVHGRVQDGAPQTHTMPRLHPHRRDGSPLPFLGGSRELSPVSLPRHTESCQLPRRMSHRRPRSPIPVVGTGTGTAGALQTVPLNNARL